MTAFGDIDGDGQVTSSDLTLLKQLLKDQGNGGEVLDQLSPEERARLDINADGQISYDDVVRLSQMLLKVDNTSAKAMADKFMNLRNRKPE